jgi:acyl-CoA reductase-like NAD-dependent aldehyde dehydrogenase
MNAGQICTSIERVYVEEPVYQEFTDKVAAKVRAIRQGPSENEVDIGSMTSQAQLEKVAAQVDQALAHGARALTGGRRNPNLAGLYYEPTVLVDVNPSMDIMTDETFGPVIPIMKVSDAEEALRLANDCRYGLSASLFSRDGKRAFGLAERLASGSACINDCLATFVIPDAPMGGIKDSGFGYRHGAEGIRKFCRQKTIVIDRSGFKEEFPWYPATAKKAQQIRHLLNFLCRSGWRNKARALKGLIRG